jgi:CheY-like chemotaxis protein
VAIIVQDNGQGMSREFLPQIFNRFAQADTSITRGQGGLGLGLAIVKHIIELHGGRVYAGSAGLGKGSTFKVEIPINAVVNPPAPQVAPAGPLPAPVTAGTVLEMPGAEKLATPSVNKLPDLAGVRVLLVDDQPNTLRVLSNVLIRCGAEIHTAGNATDALEILSAVKPDVLVSDIGLPGMDGHGLIAKVRTFPDPELHGVPALALTAFARSQDRINALEAGFNDHLAKPADAMEFARRLGRLAGRS